MLCELFSKLFTNFLSYKLYFTKLFTSCQEQTRKKFKNVFLCPLGGVIMTVYDRIKELAEKRKMTISEVETALGMGTNSLYSWKKKTPNGTSLEKAADYFNVTVDYLLGREQKADYKFNDIPFLVETVKHKDGQFEIKTTHLETVDIDLLQEINLARAKVLGSMNEYAKNNIKSGQYTEFRIEQFFIDELIERGVEVIKLKESPKPIDLKKVISEKKPTSWDDPRIDWNEWVSFDGEPISDDVKKMLFAIYGDKLTD